MKPVIVVESSAKTKTIRQFLHGEYDVTACGGHIIDLPEDRLGIDVEDGFEYEVEPITFRGNDKVEQVRDRLADYEEIYIATDPDREGEAIASDLMEYCVPEQANVQRIEFNAIVYHAVVEALEEPRALDEDRVEAQRARRALDRLIGFIISTMAQFDPEGPGLPSVGRVQSPAVSLVVDREEDIQEFTPRKYWTAHTELETEEDSFEARLEGDWDEFDRAREIVEELNQAGSMQVESVEIDPEDEQNPPPPYTTDTLQEDADLLLGFSPERTMKLAQRLYQGVEVQGSPIALITYMRTDSTRLSPTALNMAKEALTDREGKEFYKGRPWRPAGAEQDAHEAIRPTQADEPDCYPEALEEELSEDEFNLYRLIYYRFLASQMVPAVYKTTTVELSGAGRRASAEGSELLKPGFLTYFRQIRETAGRDDVDLPPLTEGTELPMVRSWPEPEQTYPPPRYREGSLVGELKKRGIGRPSTYGTILEKIKRSRDGFGYVRKIGRSGTLQPTDRGERLCEYLHRKYPQVISYEYTAKMEEGLARIEQGDEEYLEFLEREFEWLRDPYEETLDRGWLHGEAPTPAQVRFLRSLEEQTDHEVPEDVFQSKDEVSRWIDRLQEEVEPEIRVGPIYPADVDGVKCYRFLLFFNFPLPDEEWEYLRSEKMKYRPGNEDYPPSFQFQRQDRERVETLRDKLLERYSGEDSPVDARFVRENST